MDRTFVVLVDEKDCPVGTMEKLAAHQQGLLHRAFSVFIFNEKRELLLQKRAATKYHGGGLWTNTCCSHPQWEEDVQDSAVERLEFEMGLKCSLELSHSFIYKINVENNLIEHEYDYVFIGYSSSDPVVNLDEVEDFKWVTLASVLEDVAQNPIDYTYWFKVALPKVIDNLRKKLNESIAFGV
ncbi:isopentenyl-diphosphate Delta-isomerase [Pedobacter sp. MW01-1-1]|uniref:isopentenyl-diphosphate Delta-isomerase n=1 Tax=Pedobacter sp. MW01-1-1 TaxID=3383027 RepID=UPI003FEEE4CF